MEKNFPTWDFLFSHLGKFQAITKEKRVNCTPSSLKLLQESKEDGNYQKDEGHQVVPMQALGFEAKGQDQ